MVTACVVLGMALLVAFAGSDVPVVLAGWWRGAFGTPYNAVQTLSYATPLVLVALGVSVALRAGMVMVGAEGQMIVGAVFATVVLHGVGPVHSLLALPLGALAGMAGGGLWSLLSGVLLLRWRVNEILSALLADYLAIELLAYLLRTALRDPGGAATPQSAPLFEEALIPRLPVPGRLHVAALVVLGIVLVALWWHHSRIAFIVDVHGQRPWLAARLGVSPASIVLSTTAVSGAAAGLAGWMQLAGVDGRLHPGISAGIGFSGLVVAVLGRNHPVGIVVAAIAFASLTTGASGVQIATGTIPASIGTVAQAVLLLAVSVAVVLTRRNVAVRRAQRKDDRAVA
ncbi:hypothetical protein AOZ06_46455 [Kibdelosporangium phytohabitans]|uniref:ABC transporter permease n=1 Tax=Kibdelosporangium phytohabitans TaxID=860235 RepID=A0A0N9IAD2_9PSEU|nr:hypothetical protein AOZ06_46455 [Kibdelosporangium phytohabitans]